MRGSCGIVWLFGLALGCHPRAGTAPTEPVRAPTFTASRLRSFTDTLAVTAIADSASALFVGTAHGLIRWDTTSNRWTLLTTKDGLPADRIAALAVDGQGTVWVATPKGLSRSQARGWRTLPSAPVGSFLTGLLPSADGRTVWAGGPEGLARLRGGRWERYLADLSVTALVAGPNGVVWIGSGGSGVLRVGRSGDKIERFSVAQGCDVDVVRALVANERGLWVVGDGEHGPRAAFFDGTRFYSYEVAVPQGAAVIEWAAHVGERASQRTLVGGGDRLYALVEGGNKGAGPILLMPIASAAAPPRARPLKPELTAQALEDTTPPRPSVVSEANQSLGPRREAGAPEALKEEVPSPRRGRAESNKTSGPMFATEELTPHLPDGVTAVASSPRGLLVGTRFLGAERVENGVPRRYRTSDLAAGAVRLTIACVKRSQAARVDGGVAKADGDGAGDPKNDECYLATGGTRAFSFDGQAFEAAPIDPEPGSRVLAVLRDPSGNVMAIHRGAADAHLRLSRVDAGRWTPIGFEPVQVPEGAPELNFADFAPDGHLWVGLGYVDKDKDRRDYGAAEIVLDNGKVLVHRQDPATAAKAPEGFPLPNEVVAMYWKSPREGWFATRAGAVQVLDGKSRVFTENDGLLSELATAIGPGPRGEIWLTTGRGTGRFDGSRWTFPKVGAFYPRARALGHDGSGNFFVGTDKGLYCVGACTPDPVDYDHGLLDDVVIDLAVDERGRVWVLTAKGITIVKP